MNAVNPVHIPSLPGAGAAEPSMEEILASIRRIIADDGAPARLADPDAHEPTHAELAPEAPTHAVDGPEAEPGAFVHEAVSTDGKHEDVTGRDGAAAPFLSSEEPMVEPIADLPRHPLAPSHAGHGAHENGAHEHGVHEHGAQEHGAQEYSAQESAPREPGAPESIFQDPVSPAETALAGAPRAPERLVSAAADSSIVAAFNTLAASRFVANSEQLTGLVQEMIRPLVKAWVDEHLPGLVERLVVAEIERMARG